MARRRDQNQDADQSEVSAEENSAIIDPNPLPAGDEAPAAEKKTRERRKPPTVEEAVGMIRLMNFTERTSVILFAKEGLAADIAAEKQRKLDLLAKQQKEIDELTYLES